MSPHDMDDRIDREFRRQQLVRRLIAHSARTQTISDLTDLSRHQQVTLRHRWRIPPENRLRGPSPTSFVMFHSSARARSESSVLAVFCRVLRAARPGHGAEVMGAIEFGERLCAVFEALRSCFPSSDLEFEQLALLARGLSLDEAIGLERCSRCDASVLVDRLGVRRHACSRCQVSSTTAQSAETAGESTPVNEEPGTVQWELF